jgi:hypothetical protein
MLIDHIGMVLFPDVAILRIIGRLAFPIFAYFVAEGCVHTRNLKKYVLRMSICAAAFQIVQWFVCHTLTLNVVWTYIAAACFVLIYKWAKQKWNVRCIIPPAYCVLMSIVLLIINADYLCFGFLFIIFAYLMHNHWIKWIPMCLCLLFVSFFYDYQFWGLLTIPLLWLYNQKADALKIGRILYYFYPLHLLLIGVIQYVVNLW